MSGKRKTFQERVRHITPAWFAITMGTGVISALFNHIPYTAAHTVLSGFALGFFCLNCVIFSALTVCTVLRYIMYPTIWRLMLADTVQSLFLSTFPMGLTTLVVGATALLHDQRGIGGAVLMQTLVAIWWFDVVLSLLSCFALTYIMVTRHRHSMEALTAVWMLPIVAPIVASSTGGVVANSLQIYSQSQATTIYMTSIVLVLVGLSLALMLLTLYLLRLMVNGLPQGGMILSVFLPLGPCGQGGYSLLLIGHYFNALLPLKGASSPLVSSPRTGEVVMIVCFCAAFVLWSIGLFWGLFSVIAFTERALTQRIPFTITSWGVIFPSGVYALLTLEIGEVLDSSFFRILGCVFSGIILTVWMLVAFRTLYAGIEGTIFYAPCLDSTPLPAPEPEATN